MNELGVINVARFNTVNLDHVTNDNIGGYSNEERKVTTNRNGDPAINDPLWIDIVIPLSRLLEEGEKFRLIVLSKKTSVPRRSDRDFRASHTFVTAKSVMSLMLSVPVNRTITPEQIEAVRELSILTSICSLRRRELKESKKAGNVHYVDSMSDVPAV